MQGLPSTEMTLQYPQVAAETDLLKEKLQR